MYCDNCGCEMRDDIRVCPVCGKQFPLINYEQNSDEDSTTVLTSANADNDSTTVLTGSGMENQPLTPAGQPVPMHQAPLEHPMPGGMPPQGMMPQQNGMPNGMPPQNGMSGPGGMPPQNGIPQPGMRNMPPVGDDVMIKKKGEKKPMGKGAKIALITIPIVIVLAIGVFAFLFVPKFKKYNDAGDMISQGKIEEAVTLYKDLGNFKDSYNLANGDAYYNYAESLEKDGKNLEAAEYYNKAAKSKQAAEKDGKQRGKASEVKSQDAFDKASQCYYSAGMDQMNAASYDAAIDAFKNAGTYKDASDKVIECTYKKAQSLITAEDYDGAIDLLTTIEDYEDSATLLAKCYYDKGTDLLKDGKYDDAYDMFTKSEYDDYADKASECTYQKAAEYYKNKDYENAIKSYDKVDSKYKNCVKEKDKCYIALAAQAVGDKDYKKAVECYEKVEKTDVSSKIVNAKLAYIKANKNASNELTMQYLGELRYAGSPTAQKIYTELVKWDIQSFVNSSESDLDDRSDSISSGSNIYIHTAFAFSGSDSINISGYVVYADGNKSDSITFSDPVVDGWSTWVNIGDSAPKGVTYLYIKNEDTKNIIEVYPFTIK